MSAHGIKPNCEEKLAAELENKALPARRRIEAAGKLVWLRRCRAGEKIDIGCLTLGKSRVLHMPCDAHESHPTPSAPSAPHPAAFVPSWAWPPP
jgi:hypothetical protein